MVLTTAVGDDGEFGHRPLFRGMLAELTDLVAQGLITEDEVHRMCIPMVSRRAADFLSPFAPKGRFERLEIDHLEVFDAEDRFWSQYRVDHDAKAFGAQWAAFARASVFPTLAAALDGGRTDPRAPSSSIGWRPVLPHGWPPNRRRCRFRWRSWCCGSGRRRASFFRSSRARKLPGQLAAKGVAVALRCDPGEPPELLTEVGR